MLLHIKTLVRRVGIFFFPGQMELHDLKGKHKRSLKKCQKYEQMDKKDYLDELKKFYRERMGCDLNLDPPVTYCEKLQWRKLYDHNPLFALLTDKFAVRDWVSDRIGEQYLVPLVGVWDLPEQIDFDRLPKKFVLKTNNGSGTNIIVKNKDDLNRRIAKENLRYWLRFPYCFSKGFEMHYRDISPKIIAEEYIDELDEELLDYKFLCFHGKPMFVRCIGHRDPEKHTAYIAQYDLQWNKMDWKLGSAFSPFPYEIERPKHFDEMVTIATKLSEGFDFVRVDLYDLASGILFGEMTFTPNSGICPYEGTWTRERDEYLGSLWRLPMEEKMAPKED